VSRLRRWIVLVGDFATIDYFIAGRILEKLQG
jgi:hypothetical protein